MIKNATLLGLLLILANSLFGQYDSECFIENKELIKKEIKATPRDTIRLQDSLFIIRPLDVTTVITKVVGCHFPDFSFYNLDGEEFSIYGDKTDFTIINFSFTSCGDLCNAQLHQFSALKSTLKDSLTVFNIFNEPKEKVKLFSQDFEDNIVFVADAERLFVNYSLDYEMYEVFLLDKYKNILAVKVGANYNYAPSEIYYDYLRMIRESKCPE